MASSLVTLTSDFGAGSPYVAAMKGTLLAVNPAAQLVDLSHCLPPQDLRACSFFLRAAIPFFPQGTLHVVVVDPGVGTDRALLYVATGGQQLLVPDNGCWTELARSCGDLPHVLTLTERRFWRAEVSATFHGRDILAPVAGHLSSGTNPKHLGPPAASWVELTLPVPQLTPDRLAGEVAFIDDFGNLISNLPGDVYLGCRERSAVVLVESQAITRHVRTYGEAAPGELVALVSSGGTLEVAEVQGSAARRLGASVGSPVTVQLQLPHRS
jgi:S-adenosyl-L-methionine hydrolase (adenosine-forming)